MYQLCNELVEWKGQLVTRCNPNYLFQGDHLGELIYTIGYLTLFCVFLVGLIYLLRKQFSPSNPKSGWKNNKRNIIDLIVAIVLCLIIMSAMIWTAVNQIMKLI